MIQLKRVYDSLQYHRGDGKRYLVERLWPRGVKKEALEIDDWLKDIAPSAELRQWFGHDPAKWPEFKRRYTRELRVKRDALALLLQAARRGHVTLLYSASDTAHNSALVLKDFLEKQLK